MAHIIVPQRMVWTRQPQCPAGIDWSHPLAPKRGFVIAALNGVPYLYRRGLPPIRLSVGTVGAVASAGRGFGTSLSTSAITAVTTPDFPTASASDGTTVMWIGQLSGSPATAGPRIFEAGTGFPTLGYWNTASAAWQFGVKSSSTSPSFQATGSYSDGSPVVWSHDGVTLNGGAACFIRGKAQSVTCVQAGSGTLYPISSDSLTIANRPDSQRGFVGSIPIIYVDTFSRSGDECRELSENPWQIFTKRDRYAFVNLSGGSASYTITPTGSISLSGLSTQIKNKILQASGTVNLTGSASLSLTNGAIEYTISPSGFITYSGTYKARIVKSLSPSGTITYSGNAIRATTHIQTASGLITFSGSAPLYIPGSYIPTTSILLTGVGK